MSRMSEWKRQCVKNVSLQKCGSSFAWKEMCSHFCFRDHLSFLILYTDIKMYIHKTRITRKISLTNDLAREARLDIFIYNSFIQILFQIKEVKMEVKMLS